MRILYLGTKHKNKLTDLDIGHSTDNIMTNTSQPMFWNYQHWFFHRIKIHAAWLYSTMQKNQNFSDKSSFVKIKNHSSRLDLDNSRD